jgi:Domain of unknown function (DUF1707)
MPGPGGSPSPFRIRIGDAERERIFALLREHYAAGRLSLDEVRRRTEIVLSASYVDEAEAALAELPAITATAPDAAGEAAQSQRRGLLSRRGHAEVDRPAPGWVRTTERFRDPSSGMIMRVWLDPADGSRHYAPDDVAG